MKDTMMIDITELESAANFGRLMAVFLWIYGFMSPVAGMIADRVNRQWLIVGSLFVWSFVTLMMGYCTTFNQIYFLRALMGVSEALYIPAGLSLISDYHQGKTRSLAVGIHMTGLYTGQALGGFGATVASAFTWETTFHWFGIVGIVYSVVLILFLKDKKDHITHKIKEAGVAVENPVKGALKGMRLCHILTQPLLDHPALFCHPELTWLGDKKLAPYAILRKSVHRYVGSRTVIDDHDRLIFVYRCNCRRDHVGQMDTDKRTRPCLYRRYRTGFDHSIVTFARFRS